MTDHTPGEAVREHYRRQGAERATQRLIALLREKGALRDSLFGSPNWVVLQTEDGPLDIDLDVLEGKK